MSKLPKTTRRQFIAGTGTALALGSMPGLGHAAWSQSTLVVYRANEPLARRFAELAAAAGHTTLALSNDPVRQWRDSLGALVTEQQFRLTGLSNWADFTILRGLAAEARRFPQLLTRHDKAQLADQDALARHTRSLLLMAGESDTAVLCAQAEKYVAEQACNPVQPGLFGWII
jgi:hypothetical protein